MLKFVYEFINRGLNDLICIYLMWLFKCFNFKIEVMIMVLCNIELSLIYIIKERFLLCFDVILIIVNIIFGRRGGGMYNVVYDLECFFFNLFENRM